MKRKSIHDNLYICIIVFVFLALLIPITLKFPRDSAIFPMMLIIGIGILNTILLFNTLKKMKKNSETGVEYNRIKWEIIKKPLVVFLLTVVYAFLFDKTNFFIATTIYMIALMKYYKVKSSKVIILVTVITNIIIYVSFSMGLHVPLV